MVATALWDDFYRAGICVLQIPQVFLLAMPAPGADTKCKTTEGV